MRLVSLAMALALHLKAHRAGRAGDDLLGLIE
jgi:hypothetical protein